MSIGKVVLVPFLALALAACTLTPTSAPDISSNCPPVYNGCYAD